MLELVGPQRRHDFIESTARRGPRAVDRKGLPIKVGRVSQISGSAPLVAAAHEIEHVGQLLRCGAAAFGGFVIGIDTEHDVELILRELGIAGGVSVVPCRERMLDDFRRARE